VATKWPQRQQPRAVHDGQGHKLAADARALRTTPGGRALTGGGELIGCGIPSRQAATSEVDDSAACAASRRSDRRRQPDQEHRTWLSKPDPVRGSSNPTGCGGLGYPETAPSSGSPLSLPRCSGVIRGRSPKRAAVHQADLLNALASVTRTLKESVPPVASVGPSEGVRQRSRGRRADRPRSRTANPRGALSNVCLENRPATRVAGIERDAVRHPSVRDTKAHAHSTATSAPATRRVWLC
jgi:hypothetical protein